MESVKSYKSSDVDPSKVRISKVCQPFKLGTKEFTKIELKYGNDTLYILGPKLYCPFGVSQMPKPEEVTKNTNVKYSIQMNFKGHKEGFEKAQSTEDLYNLFDELELILMDQLLKKSGEYLNQQTNEHVLIDKMYQRLIKTPEKEEYDPYFRLKLPTDYKDRSKFKVGFFDEKGKELKLDVDGLKKHLENRRWIRPIFKLDCLWYIEGKIHPSIEGHLLKIYSETEEPKKKSDDKKKKEKPKDKKPKQKKIQFI